MNAGVPASEEPRGAVVGDQGLASPFQRPRLTSPMTVSVGAATSRHADDA
jgi:hypothetical protein